MICPMCGMPVKTVPAGIAKTSGRPYPAFQVCSNRNCGWKPTAQMPAPQGMVQQPQFTAPKVAEAIKKEMIISYEKDLMQTAANIMATEMAQGIHPKDVAGRVIEIFSVLLANFRNRCVSEYFPDAYPEDDIAAQAQEQWGA